MTAVVSALAVLLFVTHTFNLSYYNLIQFAVNKHTCFFLAQYIQRV